MSTATATALHLESERSITDLGAALRRMQEDGITFAEISKATDVNRTTISQLVNQGIEPTPKCVSALWAFVNRERERVTEQENFDISSVRSYKQTIDLFRTEEYVAAMGWCGYISSKRKMGVLIGAPGCGKTTILKNFATTITGTAIYVEAMPNMRVKDLCNTIALGMGIELIGNGYQCMQQLIAALKARTDIVIMIDEAEYLKKWDVDKFEYLRKIWDNTGTPIILAGTQELETVLTKGRRHENLAQLYRRKYELQLKGISEKGARDILRQYNISTDAAEILSRIGADSNHGGLGNLVEILDLCLETAHGGQITAEMVNAAKRYKLMY
jgi:DNA transposition AAA+ family ATPase